MMQHEQQPKHKQQPQQKRGSSWVAFWHGVVALDFLSNFFTWLMELLARVTEPLASLSAIYIITLAGVPALDNAQLHPVALALIIGSPELVIVGAFKIATREIEHQNKKGWWLMAACFVLLLLTALTVSDQFIWHWSAEAVNALMGCRCLAGIGYSFARGVVTDGVHSEREREQRLTARTVNDTVNDLAAAFTTFTQEAVNALHEQIHLDVHRLTEEMHQQQRLLLAEVSRVNGVTHTELNRLNEAVHGELHQVHEVVHTELNAATEMLAQQSQALVDTAIARCEQGHQQCLHAVYTRLERVTVSLEHNPSPAQKSVRPSRARPTLRLSTHPASELASERDPSSLPADGGDSKVNQARVFTVHYYHMHGELPKVDGIVGAIGCSRGLASRAYNLAKQDLADEQRSSQQYHTEQGA